MDKLKALGLDWDEDGVPIGYQVGRAAAIAEWSLKKEFNKENFVKLCEKLRKNNWWKKNPEKTKEIKKRWRDKNKERIKQTRKEKGSEYEKKARIRKRLGITYTCKECRRKWKPDPYKNLPKTKPQWCTVSCRKKTYWKNMTPEQKLARSRHNYERKKNATKNQSKRQGQGQDQTGPKNGGLPGDAKNSIIQGRIHNARE